MSGLIWLYVVICLFAGIGVVTVVRGCVSASKKVMDTANNLVTTLKDATEIARAYREDLAILRQIAQSGATPNLGNEPESIIPQTPPNPVTMPPPYWGRFTVKPEEPDAPLESVAEVDVTPTEQDVIEQERNEAAGDFEALERQKAATREADQERLRALAEASGEPGAQ